MTPVRVVWRAASFPSFVFAVGQDEDALAKVWSPNGSRTEHSPLRIEPHAGKAGEHVGSSGSKEPWDVLKEHEPGSYVANDARDVGPEPPRVILRAASSSVADGLTREPRRDEIHDSTPWRAIEGDEVVCNRCAIHGLVFHPRHDDGRGESFPFNETHRSIGVSEGESEAKLQASDPGT